MFAHLDPVALVALCLTVPSVIASITVGVISQRRTARSVPAKKPRTLTIGEAVDRRIERHLAEMVARWEAEDAEDDAREAAERAGKGA